MATPLPIQSPLRHLDPRAVSLEARAEARNRETRLPPISVFRWWARRTDAIFGGIIEALQQDRDGDLMIADPFAGGGVIPLAALARGCRVYAQEIDPWAANGIAAMLSLPSPVDFQRAREQFAARADKVATQAYGTVGSDGLPAIISHTFRVAEAACSACQRVGALYPNALVTLLARVERGRSEAFLACPAGHLFRGHRKDVHDLLMDLVPKSLLPIEQFAPDGAWELTEQRFLAFVGARFLSIGESQGPWQEGFVEALRDSEFLGNPPPETGNRRAGRSVG